MNSDGVLRLVCACGRNLAKVTYSEISAPWTPDHLVAYPLGNVVQDEYRPVTGDFSASRIHTYSWTCAGSLLPKNSSHWCGRTPTLRHQRLLQFWEDAMNSAEPGPVRRILDT